MTRRTRKLKSDSTVVLAGTVAAVGSPPIRFSGLSLSDFGQIFITQQTQVDVDNGRRRQTVLRMKTLLILRHAKSSWNDPALDDHERPLNKRGRRDAPPMGELVREYGLIPDVIISSDAVRARLTAEAVAEAARYAGEILLDPRLYLACSADILSLLTMVRENAGTVMIVGHNPGLETLVEQLTGERQDLPTAALAQIGLPIDQWRDLKRSTRGTLVGLWRPEELT
jgi:phosphohistidine phosphatase